MRYKPTRATTSTVAVENDDLGGEGQEGAADAKGNEDDAGDISGDGEVDAVAAPAVGVARTGLGESMASFFQRGATGARACGPIDSHLYCSIQ